MVRRAALGLLIWLGLVSAALAERRVALILAVDAYDTIRPLENPSNDARAMEDLLEKLDFEVFVETNRDLRRMRRALEDFQADAAGAEVALLFFAGHGVALEGVNYLLPTDADPTSSATLAATSLPLAEAQAALQAVADIAIVILDACRDDPFAGGGTDGRGAAALEGAPTPAAAVVGPGLGRVGRADGVLFAFAAAPNETASDGEGDNSPFTAALVRHLGTAGVELRTALTLVQQDVYDRSRGKQLPYVESGLPELVFITGEGVLPERDQLLIAMAGLTPDLRAEVEALAAARNMPLAPLYAAVLSADLAAKSPEERGRLLLEAAASFEAYQSDLRALASDDPRVADLRARAEEQFSLGAFDTGRALMTEAAAIDAARRVNFRDGFVASAVSEAATHRLNAGAARADLRYDLAIEDLTKAVALYGDLRAEDLDRPTQFDYTVALSDLGGLHLVAGNTRAALEVFTRRAKFAQARVEADPTDFDWVRELVWSLNAVGNVLQQQGYMTEAETAYASALEFSQWQADQMPDDVDLMRDRQVARNKLGEIRFARNDFAGALVAHQDALAIAEALLAIDPANATYRRDMSFTQERLGDTLMMLGDKAGAKAAYERSLALTEGLLAEFPADENIRRDLSISYERIGDTIIADGDYDAGLDMYGIALVIREELAALDPDNKLRQRDLSVTFERIGDIHSLRGDRDSALLAHQAATAIREKLAALDPTNMLWQRDLSVSHERMGDLYFGQNDLVAALAAQERSRSLREGIVALDPQNLPRQRDLGVAIERVGDVKLAMGDRAGAAALYQDALSLRQSVLAADPTVVQYKRDVAFSLTKLGDLHSGENDAAAAEPLYAQAVALRAELAGAAPQDTLALRDLSILQNQHAATLLTLGRNDEALAVGRQLMLTVDRLLQLAPDVADHVHDRLVALNRLGDAQFALGDVQGAVASFRAMADVGDQLLVIDPHSTTWAHSLGVALERLGDAQTAAGDLAGALKSHTDSLALRDWLVQQEPGNPGWYRNLGVNYERISATLRDQGLYAEALQYQDASVQIMRDLAAAFPDDPWYRIDLVRALDLASALMADPVPAKAEALGILEAMQAQGTLPAGYEDWIAALRQAL